MVEMVQDCPATQVKLVKSDPSNESRPKSTLKSLSRHRDELDVDVVDVLFDACRTLELTMCKASKE